jgi:hydrogenase maturation protein HypF
VEGHEDFVITKSQVVSDKTTRVSPDIAVCEECLKDMGRQPHRLSFPFINCTRCGPRFSITRDLPYDREKTSMATFNLCETCQQEYEAVLDRRFHAQPTACNSCGPVYSLFYQEKTIQHLDKIIRQTVGLVENGGVIAVKGLGGFFLMCDALNEEAVQQTRIIKKRDKKPLAVLFRDLESAKKHVHVSPGEEKSLTSWRRPIVLAKQTMPLAHGINPGLDTLGVMLPYMPFHHLLFKKLACRALVLTSGNISDEPLLKENRAAIKAFSRQADAVLTYNRDIHNRVDDSVVRVMNQKERVIRRARGYVPSPIEMPFDVDGILATGAELVNCFALGKGNEAILSQHTGDLKNFETYQFYQENIHHFCRLFRATPGMVARDLHPDYLSSKYAMESGMPNRQIQHHHAHVASCMAEHGLDEKVIGISFDGTGLGDDGHIWGGEFFIADYLGYERYIHFDYTPLPGGEQAIKEPWRTALAHLYKAHGQAFQELGLPFLKTQDPEKVSLLIQAMEKNIHCPLASSAGRLFDAVAALINLCPTSHFHAEAPMKLEALADPSITGQYPFNMGHIIDMNPVFRAIVVDIKEKRDNAIISTKFHNTIVSIILAVVKKMKAGSGIQKAVLSGGVFQNKYVLEQAENHLAQIMDVYSHEKIPTNDGGIALGQLAIAAKKQHAHGGPVF